MSIIHGRPRGYGAGALVTLLTLLIASGLSAQTEAVELRLKLTRGEILYYDYSSSYQIATEGRPTSRWQYTARRVHRVLDVDPAGVALLDAHDEDIRISRATGTTDELDRAFSHRVRPDGSVAETNSGGFAIEYFPVPLPTQPIRAGESWTRRGRIAELSNTPGSATLTLVSVDRIQDERIARVRFRMEARAEGRGVFGGVETHVRSASQREGEFQWSIDRGRLTRTTADVIEDTETTVSLPGRSGVSVKQITKNTILQQTIRPEDVAPPAVAPEVLIVRARGIGPFGLDLPVADITARVGAPAGRETDLGFRARSAKWPNDLIGFLDPSDEGKLVGLEIADRKFRTAEGIGPGSSRGAVLLRYGMSPATADMTIPRAGSVRVLIYNDAGIAFTITAALGYQRLTPLGTVNWVTVFPPGMASKIYPLP